MKATSPTKAAQTAKKKKKKKKLKLGMKIEHQTKGRVRMKVAAGKGNPELLQKIGETFSGIPGVQRITANPTTGSLVLHYDQGQYESFQRHLRGKMNDTLIWAAADAIRRACKQDPERSGISVRTFEDGEDCRSHLQTRRSRD